MRPGSTSTVLELDGGLVDIAVERLGLDPEGIEEIRVGDARLTLGAFPGGGFDAIVGDAFGGISVPWHLTTREFLAEIKARLRSDGFYVMNVIDRPPNAFAQSEAATLREVFNHVAVVAPPDYLEGVAGGNFVLAASQVALDMEALAAALRVRGAVGVAIAGSEVDAWADGAQVLHDNFAPVDQLLGYERVVLDPMPQRVGPSVENRCIGVLYLLDGSITLGMDDHLVPGGIGLPDPPGEDVEVVIRITGVVALQERFAGGDGTADPTVGEDLDTAHPDPLRQDRIRLVRLEPGALVFAAWIGSRQVQRGPHPQIAGCARLR